MDVETPVRLTEYARLKFRFFREHGVSLTVARVVEAVRQPEHIARAQRGRWVAQRGLDERHVLRVIYEEVGRERIVVTFYPARRSRYEPSHDI